MTVPYFTSSPWTLLFSASFCFCSKLAACFGTGKKENIINTYHDNRPKSTFEMCSSKSIQHMGLPFPSLLTAVTEISPNKAFCLLIQSKQELFVAYLQFLKKNHVSYLILLVLCLFGLPELFLSRISVHGIHLKKAIWINNVRITHRVITGVSVFVNCDSFL